MPTKKEPKPPKYYQIREKNTGLYSSGGTRPSFNKGGKIWKGIGTVKNHINFWEGGSLKPKSGDILDKLEPYQIIEVEIVEKDVVDLEKLFKDKS